MEIPARDIEVLRLLCRNGVMTNEQVKNIYGDTTRYYRKRLERMSKQGYVYRKSGYVSITQKGAQLVGEEIKATRVRKWNKSQRANLIDRVFKLPDWEVKFSTEIKHEHGLNRGALIRALIKKSKIEYAIYMLSAETPRAVSIGRLWREIDELPTKPDIYRAIVFCYSSKGMNSMAEKIVRPSIKELLLLPYPHGLEIFKQYHSDNFRNLMEQRFPEKAPSGRKFADFLWQGKYVTVLMGNDAVRRYYLKEYYEGLGESLEKKEVIIVCLQGQYSLFSEIFPRARFAVLHNDMSVFYRTEVIELHKENQISKSGDIYLNSFNEIDICKTAYLPIIAIYHNPLDYPNKYVARLWDIPKRATRYIVLSNSLEKIRQAIPPGMCKLLPSPHDDPILVETWL